jgi:sporulation protein YlmC with PRC-barrel domain
VTARDADRTGAADSKSFRELTMVSAASRLGNYPGNWSKPQERAMVAVTGYRMPLIWAALAVALAIGPALPQAGVQLVKVDLSVVAKGYRMSKLIHSSVINDKNEKIGTIDDVIADKDKKQLSFVVLQVGGFLGVGGRLVAIPYDSLVIDDNGQKITLPGASKDELKKLSEFNYPSS